MRELRPSQEITHKHRECRMGWDSRKHPEDACLYARVKNINDILQRGETHSHHHRIHNAVKRFIEILVVIQNETHEKEFAKLLDQRHLEHRVKKLIHHIPPAKLDQRVEWHRNAQGNERTQRAKEKTRQQQHQGLTLMLVFKINIQNNGKPGGNGKAKQLNKIHEPK